MTIMLMILALLVGLVIGFFGARKYMENYLRNNPPISEEMLRTMMLQMGQKPSSRKLHQMMQAMKAKLKSQIVNNIKGCDFYHILLYWKLKFIILRLWRNNIFIIGINLSI